MSSTEQIIELTAFFAAFGMSLSGIPPCVDMWKRNTFHEYAPLTFFFVCIINCAGWTHYGVLVGSPSLIAINLFGTIMNVVYVLMFAVKSPDKMPFFRGVFFSSLYLGIIYNYLFFVAVPEVFVDILGSCMSFTTVMMQSTPVLDIIQMYKNRSIIGIHFTIMFASTLTSLAWLLHGYMMRDSYVMAPNVVGLLLGVISFLQYGIYHPRFKGHKAL